MKKIESYFVGGRYVETADGTRVSNQAYVQRWSPAEVVQPYPLVLIHGGHQTSMGFESTPDGRPGWAPFFVAGGFDVYMLDHPGCGRSAFQGEAYGESVPPLVTSSLESRNTATSRFDLFPTARLHTQWPGDGLVGDPVFEQFAASQVPCIADRRVRELVISSAVAALLDRTGPAVLLTHSQSGAFGWLAADSRPELVKGIIAVEPAGPPFLEARLSGPPDYFVDGELVKAYAVTDTPIAYDPPVGDPSTDLSFTRQAEPDAPGLVRGAVLTDPARRLKNLSGIPVEVVTGEASYHAAYDHLTADYLRQRGVDVNHVLLGDEGIHGNCHMMMLEKNSDEVAALFIRLLQKRGLATTDFAGVQ